MTSSKFPGPIMVVAEEEECSVIALKLAAWALLPAFAFTLYHSNLRMPFGRSYNVVSEYTANVRRAPAILQLALLCAILNCLPCALRSSPTNRCNRCPLIRAVTPAPELLGTGGQ